jgi:pimeloyl-ACP methyl ester carboxylesterase
MRSTTVEVAEGVPLRVLVWTGDGVPFVLVHGLSSNALLWHEVADHLAAAGRPVYAIDLRSHGASAAPAEGYDTATAAADVAAMGRQLGLGPAVVVGQSWGASVVLRLAARHPEQVAALALVDGGFADLSAEFPSWAACEAALRPPSVDGLPAARLRTIVRQSHPDWSSTAVEATIANLVELPDGTLRRRLSIPHHLQILRSMWDEPPSRDYAAITAPVLLLPAIPTDPVAAARWRGQLATVVDALAKAEVHEYVGGDHDLHAQHPAAIAADLLAVG